MNETKKGFIQLHLSVMLAGFTGLFGRLITLNEVDIVWYRMLFTSCILLVFTGLPRVGWRKFLQLCGCGAVVRMWSLVGTALDSVLWQHQGLERVDWRHLLLADRVLYGFVRADDLQEALFWLGVPFFTDYGGWCDVYFLARCPLSLWYYDRCGVVGCLCPLCHLQQEGQRGRTQSYGTDVSDVGRSCCRVCHHPCIPVVLSQPTACCGHSRGYESLVHALSCAILHRWHVFATDPGPETPLCLYR